MYVLNGNALLTEEIVCRGRQRKLWQVRRPHAVPYGEGGRQSSQHHTGLEDAAEHCAVPDRNQLHTHQESDIIMGPPCVMLLHSCESPCSRGAVHTKQKGHRHRLDILHENKKKNHSWLEQEVPAAIPSHEEFWVT